MYGFHKSRADHSKSVFSHPSFIKDREYIHQLFRDLLITIKRKIKGKVESKNDTHPETPIKKRIETDLIATTCKKNVETGQELVTEQHLVEVPQNISFNLLGTKQNLHSLMNLNFSVNKLPNHDFGEVRYENEEEEDNVSIAEKIDEE